MAPKDDLRINLSTDRLSRIKCMECGHKNPGDVAFCTKCRAKMVLECADCGFKSPQGSEFCGSCGKETEFGIKERAPKAAEAAAAKAREARQKKNTQRVKAIYLALWRMAKKNAAGALAKVLRVPEVLLLGLAIFYFGWGLVGGASSFFQIAFDQGDLPWYGAFIAAPILYALYWYVRKVRKSLEAHPPGGGN